MIKKLLTLLLFVLLNHSLTSGIFAANSANLFVRLDIPSSPTNDNNLTLSFTVLDIQNRSLTVTCYKKNPNDSVEQLTTVNIIAGGNSGSCNLDNHTMSESGKTYSFYAVAKVDAEEFVSDSVSVEFNDSIPDTPSDYSKEKINSCDYKIGFKAGNDGQTVRIAVYRSDQTSFRADGSSLIANIDINPDEKKFITNTVPDCNKTYYYVLRAFDSAGNGSGFAGDKVDVTIGTTTTTLITPSPAVGGAIALGGLNNIDQVTTDDDAQEGDQTTESTDSGTILGEENPTPTATSIVTKAGNIISRNWLLLLGGLVLLAIGIITYVRRQKQVPVYKKKR